MNLQGRCLFHTCAHILISANFSMHGAQGPLRDGEYWGNCMAGLVGVNSVSR